MLTFINNSETALLMIHEIYGINKNIKLKCRDLYTKGYDVFCPNLLGSEKYYDYKDEKEAYVNFIQCVGIKKSVERVELILKDLRTKYKYIFVIGYSIGATIAWLCSEYKYSDGVICFYGSRIRNFTNIKPKCPIALFFAEKEKSFDVDKLIESLMTNQNIEVVNKYNGEHGFADEFSEKFHLESYQKSYEDMISFLGKFKRK